MKKQGAVYLYVAVILLINLIAVATIAWMRHSALQPVYVAVACPLSGEGKEDGEAIRKGIRLCLDRAKREGRLKGKKIELLFFNDQNDNPTALKIASQIVQDNRIVVVLGHYSSASSEIASAIYKRSGMPAITASATVDGITTDNEWYFRVVPNNRSMIDFLVHYIARTLKRKTVSIVYDRNEYGLSLLQHFEAKAGEVGVEIAHRWGFDSADKQVKREFNKIVSEVRSIRDIEVLFFATQETEAAEILSSLKYQGTDYTVIGLDTFSSEEFVESFNTYSTEGLPTGYYTNGIFAVSPFIPEIGGRDAVRFVHEYEDAYSEEPSWIASCYFDAMWTAIHALERMDFGQGLDIRDVRRNFRDALGSLNDYENAVDGITGKLFFNEHGDIQRPVSMGVYENETLIPAPVQYIPVDEPLRSDMRGIQTDSREDVFRIDGRLVRDVRVVYAGVDINEINHLDLRKRIYSMDFYVWFRYQGDFDETEIDFPDAVDPIRMGTPVFKEKKGGLVTSMYRVRGDFKGSFDFRKYPFDTHSLSVRFRHKRLPRTDLIFAPDTVSRSRESRMLADLPKHIESSLREWNVNGLRFHQDVQNLTAANNKMEIPYSRFNADIHLIRADFSSILKILLLLVTLSGMLYLIYYIPETRLLPILLIVPAIAFVAIAYHAVLLSKFGVNRMNIEYVFFAVYLQAINVLVLSIIAYARNRFFMTTSGIRHLQRVWKIIHPIVFVVSLALFVFL